jgi:hypothetical protein
MNLQRLITTAATGLLALTMVTLSPSPAQATYSIVAVDDVDGLVGAAATSCVARGFGWSVYETGYAAVPGQGALMAQGWMPMNTAWGQLAYSLVGQGLTGQMLGNAMNYVHALGTPDSTFNHSQFAAVQLGESEALEDWLTQWTLGFSEGDGDPDTTFEDCDAPQGCSGLFGGYGDQLAGTLGVSKKGTDYHLFKYAIQGNVLEDPITVLGDTEGGFLNSKGSKRLNLGDRLSRALYKGGRKSGDVRCTEQQAGQAKSIAGDSAFITVEDGDGPVAQVLVEHTCPSDAQYEGPDAPSCLSAPALAYKLYNQLCRRHLRGVLEDGQDYSRYGDYLNRCFIRYDGRFPNAQAITYGVEAESQLTVDILAN